MSTAGYARTHRNQVLQLQRELTAIQIVSGDERGVQLSPVLRLPAGADIQAEASVSASGTLRISYGGQSYLVFENDLLAAI